ncbi:MAG: DUF6036 family nucleotidyltransferase [Pseudomonadota bacterium]
MRPLNREALLTFLELALERLDGDWILIGGAVLPLLGIAHRTTVDIDIVGPPGATQEQTLVLMEIAEELGLPVEAINQAGAYFLRRQEGVEEQLLPLASRAGTTIFRPTATLYVLLKLSRLTETDLDDCRRMLEYARDHDEPVDRARLEAAIRDAQPGASPRKRTRLDALLRAVSAAPSG